MRRRAATTVALGCALAVLPTQGAAHAAAYAASHTAATAIAPAPAGPLLAAGVPAAVPVGSVHQATRASDASTLRASAVGSRVSTSAADTRIVSVLKGRTRSKVLGSRFTMTVWDTASGSYVYQRRASSSLRGASTTKILTAVGVLTTLGPEHRFPTTVRAGSTPGEVVLVAGGDPLLTSADLRALASSTAAALGALPAPAPTPTASAPAEPAPTAPAPPAPPDPDPSQPAPTAPEPTTSEPPPVLGATTFAQAGVSAPAGTTSGVAVASSGSTSDAATIVVRADDSLFTGVGKSRGWRNSYLPREVRPVGAFARDDRAVRDATADAGRYFAQALKALGVTATYAGEATAAPESTTLASVAGHSVAEAVSRMLLISDNDTAEMLFRHVAVARGLLGDWAGARTGLADTLRELSVPLGGVRIIDGSGLSLEGRLTAPALTSALNRALSPEHPELAGLRGWLPVAGRTGTLKAANKRFTSKPARCAAGMIQAKTGTVADSIALAGYATGADGQTKIFVSIVNSRPTRYSRLATRQAIDKAAASVTGCW